MKMMKGPKGKRQSTKKQSKWIRTGDTVVVTAGNEKGNTGTVLSRVGNDRVVVQGLNVRKKAVRRSEANPQGGFVDLEMPMHVSNVMLVTEEGKAFRPKVKTDKDGVRSIVGTVEGKEHTHRAVKAAK